MFTKLKKRIAEETAISPRPGGAARIPRSVSKESITSVGADSGDDFASDGSSSRDDLPSQISRRNDQIRRLEAKLSDYAEQVRNLQKMKEKLELALEKHQDSTVRKFQEQNEANQAHRARMVEEHALALEKKDQEWLAKIASLEEEKKQLSSQVDLVNKTSLNFFQKRDDLDELEVFQQQEMSKIKHMLMNKEALLSQVEQELELLRTEVVVSRAECQDAQELSARLKEDLQKLQEENDRLSQQRTELITAQEGAENKITELETRQQELQDFIQNLSLELQKVQSVGCSSEKRITEVQQEYEVLHLHHEQFKSKAEVDIEEKNLSIARLQEKINLLEKTLDGNFSGDEGLQELLKEKHTLERRLDDTRQQLLETKNLHSDSVSQMESQVAELNKKLQEANELLQQKEAEFSCLKEEDSIKLNDLEQTLQTARGRLQDQEEELKHQQEQISSYLQLEKEVESLKESNRNLEVALDNHKAHQEKLKEELSSREMVSVEIAKALEETRKQKEDLQQQLTDLNARIEENTQEISSKNKELIRRDEEITNLKRDYDTLVIEMQQLHSDLELYKTRVAQIEEESAARHSSSVSDQLQEDIMVSPSSESQVSLLQEANSTLHEPLNGTTSQEANGEVEIGDISQLQRENQELEQQITDKNKTIKQLQQRMVELKKTLQKELKLKPEAEVNDVRERPNPDPTATSISVTSSSDLTDSREINFEYLKHVVLKFMSASETEAFHLIKAVSVLLNFSREEENLLKETLEYKMSWFGSKPAPKGTVRPSISKPRTPWS